MDYFKEKGYSASMLKRYLKGCKFGELETEETPAMTFGSVFHALMAGEHDKIAVFKDDVACRAVARKEPKTKSPRSTNHYKEILSNFQNRNVGKHIVTDSDFAHIKMLRDTLYSDTTISKIVNLKGTEGEKEFYTTIEIFGETLQAKGKMDLCTPPNKPWVLDWKKVAIAPTPHSIRRRIMYEFNEDLQAAWYKLLYEATYGTTPALLWCFIMDKPPYEYLLVDMSDFIESGMNKIQTALYNIKTGQTFRTMYGDEYGICRLKREFTDL
jgi:hypothetical protein